MPIAVAAKKALTGKSGYIFDQVRQEVINQLGPDQGKPGGYVVETTVDCW